MTYTVTITFRPEATTDDAAIEEAKFIAENLASVYDNRCQVETVVRHGDKDQMKETIFNRLKQ